MKTSDKKDIDFDSSSLPKEEEVKEVFKKTPDLPKAFIMDVLIGINQVEKGLVSAYIFGEGNL